MLYGLQAMTQELERAIADGRVVLAGCLVYSGLRAPRHALPLPEDVWHALPVLGKGFGCRRLHCGTHENRNVRVALA